MRSFISDQAIVLKKYKLKESTSSIILFSEKQGKIRLNGYGIRSITSKRLAHLETGNYIKVSYNKNGDYLNLGETELIWGFSKIKSSSSKLDLFYQYLFVLEKLLPEDHPEPELFKRAISYLRTINNAGDSDPFTSSQKSMFSRVLLSLGYIDTPLARQPLFEPTHFIEELLGRKIPKTM